MYRRNTIGPNVSGWLCVGNHRQGILNFVFGPLNEATAYRVANVIVSGWDGRTIWRTETPLESAK